MSQWKGLLSGIVAAAMVAGATPVLAKTESGGMLNPPQSSAQAETSQQDGIKKSYTSRRIVTPFTAKKPAGLMKQVTQGGYTFELPAVWEIPQSPSTKEMLAAFQEIEGADDAISGVAFLAMESKETADYAKGEIKKLQEADSWLDNKGAVEIRYLRAPIGEIAEATVQVRQGKATMVEKIYYPMGKLDWIILSLTLGEDSAPTAEETAAYMAYTLKKAK